MRLWSLHPSYLDRQGLLACWREALLAQKVLAGATRGYTHHPQVLRFRAQPDPNAAIGRFLHGLADEASTRGYRFDSSLIASPASHVPPIAVTTGQLAYELEHLRAKLTSRSQAWLARWPAEPEPAPHPLFVVEAGPRADWEVPRSGLARAANYPAE